MTNWVDRPRDHDQMQQYRLVRTPEKGAISGIILDLQHTGAYTHYWGGRTIMCQQIECEACLAGRQARWYGYVSIFSAKSNQIAIYEFTPPGVNAVDAYFTSHGQLRGGLITGERIGKRANSRISITMKESGFDVAKLPPAPPVKEILLRLWEVRPTPGLSLTTSRFDATLIEQQQRDKIDAAAKANQPSKNGKH